jgi:hypothetical protein
MKTIVRKETGRTGLNTCAAWRALRDWKIRPRRTCVAWTVNARTRKCPTSIGRARRSRQPHYKNEGQAHALGYKAEHAVVI